MVSFWPELLGGLLDPFSFVDSRPASSRGLDSSSKAMSDIKTSVTTMTGLLTKLRKAGMKPAGTKKENAREGLMFQG